MDHYDEIDESNNRPIASADLEDAATEEGKNDFLREWNGDYDSDDTFEQVIGDEVK